MGWSRSPSIVWGGILVLLGVLFLLGNTGVLNNLDWNIVWPVLLIGLGAWLIVTRIGSRGSVAGVDGSEPRAGLARARLEIAVGAARLDVRGAALGDQLYRVHVDHGGTQPEVRLDRDRGILRISQRPDWFFGMGRLRVDAQLGDAVPWDVSCSTGSIRGEFDLSAVRLSGFECKTGASRIALRLPPPTGTVPIHLDGGSITIEVTRPVGTAIKVQASGGSVHLDADGTRQDGLGSREWRSSGFDSATDRYEMVVSGGAARVTVEQR